MIDMPPVQPRIEIVVASEGMSKGLAQTDGGQALARLELGAGGAYAGGQIKNITSPQAEAEAALFFGYRGRIGTFDVAGSVSYKSWLWRHGPARGAFEFGLSASRAWGRFTPRIGLTYSPDELGSTRSSLFAEAGAAFRMSPGISFSGGAGRRERASQPDYTAFNAGVTLSIGRHVSADLRYYDSDRSGLGRSYRQRVVLELRARF